MDLTRDNGGRIAQKTETVGGATDTYVYTYDPAGRLTDVSKNGAAFEHYAYDGNSNRTSWTDPIAAGTATYDAEDRLLTYGPNSYTYTANGELATKTAGGQTATYRYDVTGILLEVDLPDGITLTYLYDAANRRIGKLVNGTLVKGYLYQNGTSPLAELDSGGGIVSRFVYGASPTVPEYMVQGSQTYRFITDHLGSVRLVVNVADGTIAERLDYDAFGRVLLDTNPGLQPFGFAGGLYDGQTGLVRFGARDYDPETGRWTAKDPAGFAGGDTNLYGYVVNDPVNLTDPTGRSWSTFGWGFAKGLVVGAAAGILAALAVAAVPVLAVPMAIAGLVGLAAGAYHLFQMATDPCVSSDSFHEALGEGLGGLVGGAGAGLGARAAAQRFVGSAEVAAESAESGFTASPVGRSGNPMEVEPGINAPDTVYGRDYTGHAFDQMQGRGIPPSAVENTIQTGTASPDPIPGRIRYYDPVNNLTVVAESDGTVVTVHQGGR